MNKIVRISVQTIGGNNLIASNTVIGPLVESGNDVIVRTNVNVASEVLLGNTVVVQRAINIGDNVQVSNNVTMGKESSFGAFAVIGSDAIVRAGSIVPDNFELQIFQRRYISAYLTTDSAG